MGTIPYKKSAKKKPQLLSICTRLIPGISLITYGRTNDVAVDMIYQTLRPTQHFVACAGDTGLPSILSIFRTRKLLPGSVHVN